MAGEFDDLIPKAQAQPGTDPFADLVPQQKPKGVGDYIGRVGDMLYNGVTFGAGPSIDGALVAGGKGLVNLIQGQPANFAANYDQTRQEQAARNAETHDAYPITAMGSEVAGSFLNPLAPKGASLVAKATTLPGQMGRSALVGGGMGALSGAGHDIGNGVTDPSQIGQDAAVSGGLGTAFGAAAPPVTRLVGGMVDAGKAVWRGVTGKDIAPQAADQKVLGALSNAFQRDGVEIPQAQANLDAFGAADKPAAVMDLGGSNVLGTTRGVASLPGSAKNTAYQFLTGRQADQGNRVLGDIEGTLSPLQFHGSLDNLQQDLSQKAAGAYGDAFASGVPVDSPAMVKLLQRPAIRQALQQGRVNALNRGDDLPTVFDFDPYTGMPRIYSQGSGGGAPTMTNTRTTFDSLGMPRNTSSWSSIDARAPDMTTGAVSAPGATSTAGGQPVGRQAMDFKAADFVKRSLDESLDGMRNGMTGRLEGPNASGTMAARQDFMREVNQLDQQNNGGLYQQARNIYAGPAQSKEALVTGRDFMGEDPQTTAAQVADLLPGDRRFFQTGVAQGLKDRVLSPGVKDNQDIAGVLNTKGVRGRLDAAFSDNPGAVDNFATRLGQESQLAQNKNFVLAGSNTVNKAAEIGDMAGDPGVLISLLQGHPLDAVKFAANQFHRIGTGQGANYSDAAAQRLFTADQGANAKTLADVIAWRNAQALNYARSGQRLGYGASGLGSAFGDLSKESWQR